MSQLGAKARHRNGVQPPYWYFEPSVRDDWEVSNDWNIKTDQDAIVLGTEFKTYKVGLNPSLDTNKENLLRDMGIDNFSKQQDYLLVLRNPYNHYASVLNWSRNKFLSPTGNFSDMWIRMANEHMGNTNKIPERKVPVLYDDWFLSEDYRKSLSESLGLAHTDRRLNTVMKIGVGRAWGSSFDGMKKNGNAQNMDVLNRWKSVKDDPRFIKLCQNEELVEIAKSFGWECPL